MNLSWLFDLTPALVAIFVAVAFCAGIGVALFVVRRANRKSAANSSTPASSKSNGSEPNTRSKSSSAQPKRDTRPKLFLSLAAVVEAVRADRVTEAELDRCLFCISDVQVALAREYYGANMLDYLDPFLKKARSEGRFLRGEGLKRYHETNYHQVNRLLAENGYAPLLMAGGAGMTLLESIPQYTCVPSVSDNSLQVLWATHPLPENWKVWGDRELADRLSPWLAAEDAASRREVADELDAEKDPTEPDDDMPISGTPRWMLDMNRAVVNDVHIRLQRHGKLDEPKKPGDEEEEAS